MQQKGGKLTKCRLARCTSFDLMRSSDTPGQLAGSRGRGKEGGGGGVSG